MAKKGKKSYANRGRNWETRLNRVHSRYLEAGDAYIARLHPPYLMRKRTGKGGFEGILLGQGPPDYLICSMGYTFLVDAKEHKSDRLPYARIPIHQATAFDMIHNYGGPKMGGLLLINFAKSQIAVAMDWRDVRDRYYKWAAYRAANERTPSGAASLTLTDAKEEGLWWETSESGATLDYLPSVILALQSRELIKSSDVRATPV